MPKISIIIPVYNAEDTLQKCVDSLLAQSFEDFELILIDDGSRDMSPQICDEYATRDSRILVIHKDNGGVSSARNKGLEHASGQWITFVDSDDWVDKDFFPTLDTKADIVFGSYRNVLDGKYIGGFNSKVLCGLSLPSMIQRFGNNTIFRGPCAKFFRRDIIGQIRFPVDMKVGEDTCFVFHYLARTKSFSIAPDSTYLVRNIEEINHITKYSLSIDYALQSLSQILDAFEQMRQHLNINRHTFYWYVAYFKSVSRPEWKSNPNLWYKNPRVRKLYKYVWPDLSMVEKLRLVAAYLLKK